MIFHDHPSSCYAMSCYCMYAMDYMYIFLSLSALQEMLPELTELAQQVNEVDPYRSESCSVIGECAFLVGRGGTVHSHIPQTLAYNIDFRSLPEVAMVSSFIYILLLPNIVILPLQ